MADLVRPGAGLDVPALRSRQTTQGSPLLNEDETKTWEAAYRAHVGTDARQSMERLGKSFPQTLCTWLAADHRSM